MGQDLETAASAAERDSNAIIEQQLDERIQAVEQAANADGLTYIGPIFPGVNDAIKDAVEATENRRRGLLVIIETPGGYIDVAERIARVFRHHYARVDFLVPNFAMSAGTVLVMSGDAIHMDYASVLGPVDPQVQRGDDLVPALGYLEQYNRLVEKSADGTLTTATTRWRTLDNTVSACAHCHGVEDAPRATGHPAPLANLSALEGSEQPANFPREKVARSDN